MKIKKLKIAGLRALNQVEFEFHPGMNILVGVNGVGKTTVLDALRFSLSRVFLPLTNQKLSKVRIDGTDIRIGAESAQIECEVEYQGKSFNLLLLKQKQQFVEGNPGEVRAQVIERPDIEEFFPADWLNLFPNSKQSNIQPIGVFYSVRRSIPIEQKQSTVDSFSTNRDFNLQEIAEWIYTKEVLAEEDPRAGLHVGALRYAADKFLPEYRNLHVVDSEGTKHLIIEKNGIPLNVKQLSDGERGVLALALDLARRLSIANPGLDNPVADGEGIILIDELDLHLHPKWQRTIVENLTKTFPKCQFIATTHSPQIIPSVDPESVLVMKDGKIDSVNRSLGMDSNWVLKFLMETDDRPHESDVAIKMVEDLILAGNFTVARQVISEYKQKGFDLAEWAMFEARIARMEILKK
jgi:predicted ATP-binding protein involved in virulence